ncbi:MAG: VanZ family protein [Lacibacter sp.]
MKEKVQQYLRTKWPAILWSVIVFILLAMPAIKLPTENKIELTHIDKVIHFILFFTLVFLWGYYLQTKRRSKGKFLLALIAVTFIATFYGILMEYVQLWTGRDFDVWDMVADGVGAVASWLLFAVKDKPR